jgi:diketogulonate reductase-like aldo/keto reductase
MLEAMFLYGTAWKEDRTQACVEAALEAGFRAIDTANQRRHYFEEGVGRALKAAKLPREQLFLQSKFTFRDGQDHRLPYDERAPIATQVAQSYKSSLEHLGVERLDSYVLHGPSQRWGWADADRDAWTAMEALKVPYLGVSNVTLEQLQALCASAKVQPAFVQNRCYARMGWDGDVRKFCRSRGIRYQGFSLLTANPQVLSALKPMAKKLGRTPEQLVFRFSLDVGMVPLTGTTDPEHMRQDLDAAQFRLMPEEVAFIEAMR